MKNSLEVDVTFVGDSDVLASTAGETCQQTPVLLAGFHFLKIRRTGFGNPRNNWLGQSGKTVREQLFILFAMNGSSSETTRLAQDMSDSSGFERDTLPLEELENMRRIVRMLETAIRIPGLNVRLGFDSIVGLVPGIGDLVAAGFSSYLLYRSYKLGIRKRVLTRMLANIGLDTLVGSVPVFGDVFDVVWKSNTMNLKLLEQELRRRISV